MTGVEPVVAPATEPPLDANRWQLTADSLQALLQALDVEQSRAVVRYNKLHERLVFFFMRHRSLCPEDLADICLNRLARKLLENAAQAPGQLDHETINPGGIENIEAFALGIARMVHREDYAGTLRSQRALSEAFSQQPGNESSRSSTLHEEGELLDIMEEQFSALSPSVRQMLSSYHLGRGEARIERRRKLAEELGISIGALRKRVFDLQTNLRRRLDRARDHALSHREEPEHS